MHARVDSFIAEIGPGRLFRLERAATAVIEVAAGRVWVTEAGRTVDAILRAGEHHRVEAATAVVVEAIEAARIVIRAPAMIEIRASGPSRLRTFFARRRAAVAPVARVPQ